MIIYDLANHLLQSTTIECLRYSNAKQSVVVRIVGTVPTASYWQAAIALSTRLVESEILARNEAADVAISGNDITIKFKTSTNNWLTATSECPNGVRAWMVLRPFDSVGEEMDYILVPIMVFPVVDPTGVMPPPSEVTANYVVTLNGNVGALSIRNSAGTELSVVNGVITLDKAAVGLSNVQNILDNLTATAAPTATDDSSKGYSKKSQWIYAGKFYTCVDATPNVAIWTEGGGGAGDVTAAGNNTFTGANSFTQSLTVGGRTVSGLYPDRNPVAQVPVLDAALGVCHYLDATFTEIDFSYPVWHLVEIQALVCSVNPAITGTVEITPYIDDTAQTPVTINVGADWGAVTIPLIVETGSIRLVRTGGTLADGSWVTAAFRGITAMVTI